VDAASRPAAQPDPAPSFNRGIAAQRSGDLAGAATAYLEALSVSPGSAEAARALVVVLRLERRLDAAVAELARHVGAHPDALAPRAELGRLRLLSGRRELARREADEVLRRDDRHVSALLVLAELSTAEDKPTLARRVIARIDELGVHDPVDAFRLGQLLLVLGEESEARIALTRAVALRPGFIEAQTNLGVLLARRGDLEAALSYLHAASRACPTCPQPHLALADLQASLGRLDEAEQTLRTAAASAPASASVRLELASVLLSGDNAVDQAAAQEAVSLLEEARRLARESGEAVPGLDEQHISALQALEAARAVPAERGE